tara:strand:- start:3262 stop:3639 length:378 start_codon:yes stop_codon:yes gene_type:complete
MVVRDKSLFKECMRHAIKVRERVAAGNRPTANDLKYLRIHIDALLLVLDPLSELYEEVVRYDAGVERQITNKLTLNAPKERVMQNKYRSKYRKLLQKFLTTRTNLSLEETTNFLKILDPDAMIKQ